MKCCLQYDGLTRYCVRHPLRWGPFLRNLQDSRQITVIIFPSYVDRNQATQGTAIFFLSPAFFLRSMFDVVWLKLMRRAPSSLSLSSLCLQCISYSGLGYMFSFSTLQIAPRYPAWYISIFMELNWCQPLTIKLEVFPFFHLLSQTGNTIHQKSKRSVGVGIFLYKCLKTSSCHWDSVNIQSL